MTIQKPGGPSMRSAIFVSAAGSRSASDSMRARRSSPDMPSATLMSRCIRFLPALASGA
jgi:hypothetical protein